MPLPTKEVGQIATSFDIGVMRHEIGSHVQAAAVAPLGSQANTCRKGGSTLAARPPVEQMDICSPFSLRRPLPGRPTNFFAGFRHLVRQGGMRLGIEPQVKERGPLSRLAALLCIRADFSQPIFQLRLALRGWLRLSLLLSLRWLIWPKRRYRAPQRHLRARRFADIPTPLPIQNTIKEVFVMFSIRFSSTSLALDACAIASALAPQRFSTTSATAPVVPAPQSVPGSALAPQHLAINRPLPWGSA